MEPKRLGLLRELVPQARTFGVLVNPNSAPATDQLRELQEAARALGLQLHVFRASTDDELEAAFESTAQNRIAALTVAGDAYFNSSRRECSSRPRRSCAWAVFPGPQSHLRNGPLSCDA
jgi:putative tryptophan/tyrosine transport system substrate-binding protein